MSKRAGSPLTDAKEDPNVSVRYLPRSRLSALRTRAIARAEMFDQRPNHAADAKLLRDLVAEIDRLLP